MKHLSSVIIASIKRTVLVEDYPYEKANSRVKCTLKNLNSLRPVREVLGLREFESQVRFSIQAVGTRVY